MASLFNPAPINSTTFADVVALQMGLTRIPQETSANFLDRLYSAAASRRDHSMEGTVNELCFQLGPTAYFGIAIAATDPTTVFTAKAGAVLLTDAQGTVSIPTVTIDQDNYWSWLFLSDVVAAINTQSRATATLQSADKPAYVLLAQSSLNYSIAEAAIASRNQLAHSGVIVGSERFNLDVPTYTLTTAGLLIFSSAPPATTAITYSFNSLPYEVTCSDVALINLLDPGMPLMAKGNDGGLVHQAKEYVQDLLTQDACYWGK
jgi:hypothetical protein